MGEGGDGGWDGVPAVPPQQRRVLVTPIPRKNQLSQIRLKVQQFTANMEFENSPVFRATQCLISRVSTFQELLYCSSSIIYSPHFLGCEVEVV